MKEKIKNAGKTVWRETKYFFSSGYVWKHFISMLVLIVALVFLALLWMNWYTNHGKSLEVDDYTNLRIADAVRLAERKSFQTKIIDSIFVVGKRSGIVLEQNPKPFSKVKKNRTIYLTVTKENPDMVTLPGLVGNYNYGHYSKKLKLLHVFSKIKKKVVDFRQEENTILYFYYNGKKITETSLKKGVKVPMGAVLEFVVTEKGQNKVEVPNLVCHTLEEAQYILEVADLKVGKIHKSDDITHTSKAYIWRQKPDYLQGKLIKQGTKVELFLRKSRPDGCK